MKKIIGLLTVLVMLVPGLARALTPQEEKATRPEDLGVETIDVSHYPQAQQDNYQVFLAKCSICHSPARAIYSKITGQEDWEHFVSLMHARLRSRGMGPLWQPQEGRRVIDFLAYDSQIRKLDNKVAFEETRRQLTVKFTELQKEKMERSKHIPTKPSAPYTGDKP